MDTGGPSGWLDREVRDGGWSVYGSLTSRMIPIWLATAMGDDGGRGWGCCRDQRVRSTVHRTSGRLVETSAIAVISTPPTLLRYIASLSPPSPCLSASPSEKLPPPPLAEPPSRKVSASHQGQATPALGLIDKQVVGWLTGGGGTRVEQWQQCSRFSFEKK